MLDFFSLFYNTLIRYWFFIPVIIFFTGPLVLIAVWLGKDITLTRTQWIKLYWSEICSQLSGFTVILGFYTYFH